MSTRTPRHAGPYDAHDDRLWRDQRPLNENCDRCNTNGKGKYRMRTVEGEAS